MYKWLGRQLEGRSVSEMSILHTLTCVGSLLATVFLTCFSFCRMSSFLIALAIWVIFSVWLWFGLVVTAWKSSSNRLGEQVFRILQIVFFLMLVVTSVFSGLCYDDMKAMLFLLSVFDIIIAWMSINFLFLAWCARCKITLRTYYEIGTIGGMAVLQLWLLG